MNTAERTNQWKRWAGGFSASLCVALMAFALPAKAQTQVFFDNFGACTSTNPALPAVYSTANGGSPPIRVTIQTTPSTFTCSGWAFQNTVHLTTYASGTAFPSGATKAMWLNEGPGNSRVNAGTISRTLNNMVRGNVYRVSADAWTDETDGDTGLGVEFGSPGATVTERMPMASRSGVQSINAQLCAKAESLTLTLFENGSTASSKTGALRANTPRDSTKSTLKKAAGAQKFSKNHRLVMAGMAD